MWMGTHSNNPSYDYETKRSLEDFIKDNQMLMGNDVVKKYGEKLPFLFKVLSAQKALSIQAHPNKKLAKELHEKNPKEYKDDNHKPEMTIAITPFEGLCGFRPLKEVSYFLKAVKSFRKLVGEDAAASFETTVDDSSKSDTELKQALKDAFSSLMNAKEEDIKAAVKELLAQLEKEDQDFAGGESTPTPGSKAFAELLPRLNGQFPNDIGLFVVFFLNYVELQPGEAMFLQADDIHAYISGGMYPASPTIPPAILTTPHRHHGMHGLLRQRSPCRLHTQIQRRPHPHQHAHLQLRAHSRAKNVTLRLPLLQVQHYCPLLRLQRAALRSPNRRIRRREDRPQFLRLKSHFRRYRRAQHSYLHRGPGNDQRGTQERGDPRRLGVLRGCDGRGCSREQQRRQAVQDVPRFLRDWRGEDFQRREALRWWNSSSTAGPSLVVKARLSL